MKHLIISALALFFLFSCQKEKQRKLRIDPVDILNPAQPGFNKDGSDFRAIEIADRVMLAMGGRKNWDQTRFLTWNFFGGRTHTWDRYEGRDSIFIHKDSTIIDVNINTLEGRLFMGGEEITNADSLSKYLQWGKEAWINDSYWLVMPFKLKDNGVTLKYLGEEEDPDGAYCHVLELTFESVGVTPQNKYEVMVDTSSMLVSHWKYYPQADMDTARIVSPWKDYQKYGDILLSGERGFNQLSNIEVLEQWP